MNHKVYIALEKDAHLHSNTKSIVETGGGAKIYSYEALSQDWKYFHDCSIREVASDVCSITPIRYDESTGHFNRCMSAIAEEGEEDHVA